MLPHATLAVGLIDRYSPKGVMCVFHALVAECVTVQHNNTTAPILCKDISATVICVNGVL